MLRGAARELRARDDDESDATNGGSLSPRVAMVCDGTEAAGASRPRRAPQPVSRNRATAANPAAGLSPLLAGPRWFCVRSQPKREHLAAGNLRTLPGVEVFCPRIRFRKMTRRGPVWFVEALFPGYLFAGFDYGAVQRAVRHAVGVRGIVHFGERVAVLDEAVIAALRDRVGTADEAPIIEVDPEIKVGDVVNIAGGAFGDLASVVTQVLSGKERVRVLIDFLGRQVEAEVGRSAVVREGPARAVL